MLVTLTSFSRSQEDLGVPMISLEPVDEILPNLPEYIIVTSLRAD